MSRVKLKEPFIPITEIDTLPEGLSAQQYAFAAKFLETLDRREAAIYAGYSIKSPMQSAQRVIDTPAVKAYIESQLTAAIGSADENVMRIKRMSETNMARYMVPVNHIKQDNVRRGLADLIKDLEFAQDIDDDYMMSVELDEREIEELAESAKIRSRRIAKYRAELVRNPQASRIVPGPEYLHTTYELDIAKIIEDKQGGLIKSVTHTKDGLKVETVDPMAASALLARIHGSFEKDNEQSRPIMPVNIQINVTPPKDY